MQSIGNGLLLLAGSLSFAVAVLHIVIIFIGAPGYRYFGAGEAMADLAESESILPTLLTLFLASLFAVSGLYGFSGAGLIGRLPFLRTGLAIIAGVYTLRGVAVIPQVFLLMRSPQAIEMREVVFSLVSLIIGLVYLIATFMGWKDLGADNLD